MLGVEVLRGPGIWPIHRQNSSPGLYRAARGSSSTPFNPIVEEAVGGPSRLFGQLASSFRSTHFEADYSKNLELNKTAGNCLGSSFVHFFPPTWKGPTPTRRRIPVKNEFCFHPLLFLLTNDEQPKAAPANGDRRIRALSREVSPSGLEEGEKRTHRYQTQINDGAEPSTRLPPQR